MCLVELPSRASALALSPLKHVTWAAMALYTSVLFRVFCLWCLLQVALHSLVLSFEDELNQIVYLRLNCAY